jgi:hypothetical protein
MKEKVVRSGLLVAVICIVAFVASYGTFVFAKEKACAKSLYSDDCYRTYSGFLELYLLK